MKAPGFPRGVSCSARCSRMVMATTTAALVATAAHATEGGVGRPITGDQITPYAGIVPPTSDWIVTFATIYYQGSLGASKSIPVAGTVTAGLNYQVLYTIANLVKTWGITAGGWNFASSFGVPFQYTNASSFHWLAAERPCNPVRRYLFYPGGSRLPPDENRSRRPECTDLCADRRL